MTHTAIRNALEGKLLALAGLVSSSVAWPGMKFPATDGASFPAVWYKPALLPGTVFAEVGSNSNTHPEGDYQVSVFAKVGSGTNALYAAADALAAHFDRASLASGALHCGVPEIGPVLTEADWLHLPVTIPYRVL